MRGKKDELPPASGGRMSFNEDAAPRLKKKSARGELEDVTFLGPQLIIALVTAVFIGGIAGAVFRDEPQAPARRSATQAARPMAAASVSPAESEER